MITILSGSPRKNSITSRVAKAIQLYVQSVDPQIEVHIIDFYGFDIPGMNQGDMDPHHLSPWQQNLFDKATASELIFVLSPEYNWFPSAEIIQMIHQMTSRAYQTMWNNKVFATCGVSNGRGGRMPAVQLAYTINKIISVFNYESTVSSKVFESQFTDKVLDENGVDMGNPEYMKGLRAFVDYSMRISQRWNQK